MIKAGGIWPPDFKNILLFQLVMTEVNEKIRIKQAAQ
jgi:hypothetical protein